jgi:hypothetical protein
MVSVTGVASGRSTPCFRIEDRMDLNADGYEALLVGRWRGNGARSESARRSAAAIARIQLDAAARFPVGREFNLRAASDRKILLGLL